MAILIDNPANVIPAAPDAPILIDYDTEVIAPSTDFWLLEPSYVTKDASDYISAIATQKTTGGVTLTQATAAQQPLYIADAIDGNAAMRFARDPSGAPDRFLYTFPAGASLSWTKIVVLRTDADQTGRNGKLWGTDGTNAHRMDLAYSGGDGDHFLCRAGAGLASSAKILARPAAGVWWLAKMSFDHVLGQVAAQINGGAWTLAATTGVTVDVTASAIGAGPSDGSNVGCNADLALVEVVPVALHLEANATLDSDIDQFVRDYFDLTID
jgi:hypothetical protein